MEEDLDYTILPSEVLEKLAELSLELSEGKFITYFLNEYIEQLEM